MMLAITLALVAMQAQPVQMQSPLDKTIRAQGLDDLTDDQIARVRKLVTAVMRVPPTETLSASATAYLEQQGYKVCQVQFVSVKLKDYIIVDSGYGPYATDDIPFGLNPISNASGSYFCKPAILGGASEMIDTRGREHRFIIAQWTRLR